VSKLLSTIQFSTEPTPLSCSTVHKECTSIRWIWIKVYVWCFWVSTNLGMVACKFVKKLVSWKIIYCY